MPHSVKHKRLKMDDAITYKIRVQGFLEDIWSDRLAQMNITASIMEGSITESQLVGKVRDQAELLGILNGLYELRMPLLHLEILTNNEH